MRQLEAANGIVGIYFDIMIDLMMFSSLSDSVISLSVDIEAELSESEGYVRLDDST
jgi:hypothetical protein